MSTDDLRFQVHEPKIHGAAAQPIGLDSKDDEVYLLDVLIALAVRKRTILLTTAAFAILAIVISLILPKTYTATVSLLPPQQNSSISAGIAAAQLGSLGGMASLAGSSLGLKNPNDMYVGMLKSRTVEDAMVQRFDLMKEYRVKYPSEARAAFEHHVVVDGSVKDNLIHISMRDQDPNRAAELANGYVDQFRKLSEHLAITEASQRRLFFEQQLEEAKDNLASAEEALKQTEQKTGLIQLDSQARALIEAAAALRAQIMA
ncbi:MAG: Wzz/FepE/Etk N-terminal domain-containing protein, partial [Terracidiphilus sp.]